MANSGEFLLELLSEEIPARMQRRAIGDLVGLIRDKLTAADLPPADIRGYVTPRRLAVIADGIPAHQPERSEERRGPRVGAPPQALQGFLRGAGLASIDECEIRDTGRGEFYFAVITRPGAPTGLVLLDLLRDAIFGLPWPKSMRFPAASLRWVRPMTSVVCLYEGEIVRIPLGDIPVGDRTRGHRFLSPDEIKVEDAADYLAKLEAAHVILDQDRRRDLIAAELDRLAKAEGLAVKPDPGLLDEVTGLVEYPVPLMGAIDDSSMELPSEVLATAMRTHQKYFSCLKAEPAPARAGDTPAPRFLFVANNQTPDGGKTIIAGNERVLRARLADARFFWDQDHKSPLADRVDALKHRVYYDKLGTMLDKTERLEKLAAFLAKQLAGQFSSVVPAKAGTQGNRLDPAPLDSRVRRNDGEGLAKLALRAARLAKADLSTGMVGEFPELQGVMGRYYALHDGEDPRVADAIADHYKPLGPNDTCPNAPVSIILALADKIDALTAFFSVGEAPTGSRDPFALRRAALGVIRIVLDSNLHLPLNEAISTAYDGLIEQREEFRGPLEQRLALIDSVRSFLLERVRVHLRDTGISHDLVDAVFSPAVALTQGEMAIDDLVVIRDRIGALNALMSTEDGTNLLTGYRRASNIVAIEGKRDNWTYDQLFEDEVFTQQEEHALAEALGTIGHEVQEALRQYRFGDAMSAFARLREPIDEFFEKVTVNTDEKITLNSGTKSLRTNRLKLLTRIRNVMNQVADFSQIEG